MNHRSAVRRSRPLETIGTWVALGGSGLLWAYAIYSFLIAALGG